MLVEAEEDPAVRVEEYERDTGEVSVRYVVEMVTMKANGCVLA